VHNFCARCFAATYHNEQQKSKKRNKFAHAFIYKSNLFLFRPLSSGLPLLIPASRFTLLPAMLIVSLATANGLKPVHIFLCWIRLLPANNQILPKLCSPFRQFHPSNISSIFNPNPNSSIIYIRRTPPSTAINSFDPKSYPLAPLMFCFDGRHVVFFGFLLYLWGKWWSSFWG
jgi:hypothetical protein